MLGAALSSMGFAESAEALTRRGRRRCLKRGGMVCGAQGATLRQKYCCQKGTTCAGGKTCAPKCSGGGSTCLTSGNCGDPANNCGCFNTVEGGSSCVQLGLSCATLPICVTSQDCPTGHVCAPTCCNQAEPVCNPPCGTTMMAGTSEASTARNAQLSGVR